MRILSELQHRLIHVGVLSLIKQFLIKNGYFAIKWYYYTEWQSCVGASTAGVVEALSANTGCSPCDNGRLARHVNVRIAELAPAHLHGAHAHETDLLHV